MWALCCVFAHGFTSGYGEDSQGGVEKLLNFASGAMQVLHGGEYIYYVDGDWTSTSGASIHRLDLRTREVILVGVAHFSGRAPKVNIITLAADGIYFIGWNDGDVSLGYLKENSTEVRWLAHNIGPSEEPVVVDNGIYFKQCAEQGRCSLAFYNFESGVITPLAVNVGHSFGDHQLMSDGSDLYFIGKWGGIMRYSPSSGGVSTVTSPRFQDYFQSGQVKGNYIYWYGYGSDVGRILRVSRDASNSSEYETVVAETGSWDYRPNRIGDSNYVYFFDWGRSAIVRVPNSGGRTELVHRVEEWSSIYHFDVGTREIVWTDGGRQESMYMMLKPEPEYLCVKHEQVAARNPCRSNPGRYKYLSGGMNSDGVRICAKTSAEQLCTFSASSHALAVDKSGAEVCVERAFRYQPHHKCDAAGYYRVQPARSLRFVH